MPTSDTLVSPQHILPPLDFQFCDSPEESISFPSVLSFTSLWKDPVRDRTPGRCQGKPTALGRAAASPARHSAGRVQLEHSNGADLDP